jgi:hypothetical protein
LTASEQDVGSSTIKVQIRSGKNRVDQDAEATVSYTITVASGGSGSLPVISGLYPSLASPRSAGTKVDFICIASDADNDPLFYRFVLTGPGTASQAKIVQDWSARNAWSWTPADEDVGLSTIEVQVRDGKHAGPGSYDAHTSIIYTISSNIKPAISSLTASLASPQLPGQEIELICTASDAEGNEQLYKFWLTGPGTGGVARDMTGWISRNSFTWKPGAEDVGTSTIKVQVRDSNHSPAGGYDDQAILSYTINAATLGTNSLPTITSLTANLPSPQKQDKEIKFVCIASDADGDEILYRFAINGPGTGSKLQDMTGWQKQNSLTWKPAKEDIGTSTIYAYIRDGEHAGPGGYDAQASLSYIISQATPTITSLTPSLATPQNSGKEITWVCVAADTDTDELFYKFWLKGPRTGNVWQDMTGWISRNSWSWKTEPEDVGGNQVKVQIIDMMHALKGNYDAESTSSAYTIAQTIPIISTFTSSLPSPQPPGIEIELVCTALDADGNELLYRFWHQPSGASYWKDLSGWQSRNWTIWKPTLADSGTNGLKVQVIDGKHAENGGYDASATISYIINPGISNVLTFYRIGPDDKVYYLVGTTWMLLSDQTVSRISVASDGTIAVIDLATTALLIWTGSSWVFLGGLLLNIVAISSTLIYGIGTDNNIWKNENGAWSLVHATYTKYMDLIITNG